MSTKAIENLEKMLSAGKDSALLRFSLGSEYLKARDAGMAAGHLQRAVALDPGYSAAWKLLGSALTELGSARRGAIGVPPRHRSRRAERRQAGRQGDAGVRAASGEEGRVKAP